VIDVKPNKIRFRKHDALCMVADCLGLQEYQVIIVSFPYAVPGTPPIVVDTPVKVCRLHRINDVGNMFKTQENLEILTEVMLKQGLREPAPERTGVEFRTLPPKDFDKTVVIPPNRQGVN
jgi:hypothetical protein